MMIPKYNQMYRDILEYMADGKNHTTKEIRNYIATKLSLTAEEQVATMPSGKGNLFSNRINWSCVYLKKANLLFSPARAVMVITEEGRKALLSGDNIDNNYLMQFENFRKFMKASKKTSSGDDNVLEEKPTEETPDDILERTIVQINESLADDLLEEVLKLSPKAFEQFVLDLMSAMGYGTFDNASKTTAITGDEGIDGIIMEDKLGFDLIYVQAKRWDKDKTVGRPDVQAFVGAIAGKDAKGLFVTTSKFSEQAIQYAKNQHIILIDGQKLVRLMIEHNFGVTVKRTFSIKALDTDVFNDYQDL